MPVLRLEGGERGLEILQQRGDIAEPDIVDGALDRAAEIMSKHDDGFWARNLGGIFQAADDIGVDAIAGDARAEHVSDALVEYEFRRHAGIDAADDRGEWRLVG